MSDNLLIMTLVHCLEKLFVLVLSQMLSRLNLMHFDITRIWISKYLKLVLLYHPRIGKIIFFPSFYQF